MSRIVRPVATVEYPSGDGQPMAENDWAASRDPRFGRRAPRPLSGSAGRLRVRRPLHLLRGGKPARPGRAGRVRRVRRPEAQAPDLQAVGGRRGARLRYGSRLGQHVARGRRAEGEALRTARGAGVLAVRPDGGVPRAPPQGPPPGGWGVRAAAGGGVARRGCCCFRASRWGSTSWCRGRSRTSSDPATGKRLFGRREQLAAHRADRLRAAAAESPADAAESRADAAESRADAAESRADAAKSRPMRRSRAQRPPRPSSPRSGQGSTKGAADRHARRCGHSLRRCGEAGSPRARQVPRSPRPRVQHHAEGDGGRDGPGQERPVLLEHLGDDGPRGHRAGGGPRSPPRGVRGARTPPRG